MNIAVIVPKSGKGLYQDSYDMIITAVENKDNQVISPEKVSMYQHILSSDTPLHTTPQTHYEFMRKAVLICDAVIVEASKESFRVAHEATLALFYHKPVLVLSCTRNFSDFIFHPNFYSAKYEDANEIPNIIDDFLQKVIDQNSIKPNKLWTPFETQREKTVVVFGGVYTDFIQRVAAIPKEDEVALSDLFMATLGGKASNAAVALARLGNNVFVCGGVGSDTSGNELEATLAKEGVYTDFLYRSERLATGAVFLTLTHRAKYSTVVHESVNVELPKRVIDDVFTKIDEGSLHVDGIYLTLEQQETMIEYIISEAAKRNIFIFCDAAPFTRPINPKLLPLVDVVAPNQLEAAAMTGVIVTDEQSALRAAKLLLKNRAKKVVITISEQGALYATKKVQYFVRPPAVEPLDEAGAGDAFRASLLHGLLRGQSYKRSLERATQAGAYAVEYFGSYNSMPTTTELDAFEATHRLG